MLSWIAKHKWLCAGTCLFIGLRILVLLVSKHIYSNDSEELFVGNLAVDTLSGRLLPIRDYMNSAQHGASLVNAISAIPFFCLLGSSYFVLKLSYLSFSALAFVLVYQTVAGYAGRKAAQIACALFLLPPANMIFYQLHADANHQCLPFFFLAMLCLYRRIQTAPRSSARLVCIILLGLVMGFSLFCWVTNLLAVGIVFLFCLWHWRSGGVARLFAKAGLLLASAGVGMLPMVLHWRYLLWYFGCFARSEPKTFSLIAERTWALLGPALLSSFAPMSGTRSVWTIVAFSVAVFGYFWTWRMLAASRLRRGSELLLFVAVYPPVYSFAIACSQYALPDGRSTHPYLLRYAGPTLAVLLLAQALATHDFLSARSRVRRGIGLCLFAWAIAFGLYSLASVLVPLSPGAGFHAPGYFAQEIGCRVGDHGTPDFAEVPLFTALLKKVELKQDRLFRTDIERGAAWMTCSTTFGPDGKTIDPSKFPMYLAMVESNVPLSMRQLFKEELGSFVLWNNDFDLPSTLAMLTNGLSPGDAEMSYRGIARAVPARVTDPSKLNKLLREIPAADPAKLAYAMGQYFATAVGQDNVAERLARSLQDGESFARGCKDPYGLKLDWAPTISH